MNRTFKVKLDGAEKAVTAEVVDKKIWFKMDDQVFSCDLIELVDAGFKKTKTVSKSPDRVLAPMPGKVTKVFISENQVVQKGDALFV